MPDNLATLFADDAKSHTIDLLRIEAGMRLEVVGMLTALEKNLIQELSTANLTAAKQDRLNAFLTQTTAQIASAHEQIKAVGAANLEKVATITSKQTAKSLNAGIGVDIGTVLSPQQLTRIAKGPVVQGSPISDWWDGQSEAAQRRFKGAVQQGLLLGEDMAAITRRVGGTKANNYADGALAVNKREAASLTRTAVQSVANQARLETLIENDDVVKGIEWVATLDSRTTKTCMALDGKKWRLPDFKPVGHDKKFPGPVAHWACRSTQVAVTYSWAELANKKPGHAAEARKKEGIENPQGEPEKSGNSWGQLSGKKIPKKDKPTFEDFFKKRLAEQGFEAEEIAKIQANTRASMDGQVSDAKDWQAWLTDKGDTFAIEKLGPKRFKMWKEGKLTLSDLTDQYGRELTVAELEAAIDAGKPAPETEGREFKPAGVVPTYKAEQEAAATVAVLQAQQQAAAKTLADYVAKAEGQTLKNKWAKKVDAELGAATDTEKLAWVEAKAADEQAAKSKASVLSTAKKKLVAGKPATPAQQKLIDSLTDEEKANFDEAVADAIAKTTGAKAAALKAEIELNGGVITPEVKTKLGELPGNDIADVVAFAQGVKAEADAGTELAAMKASGTEQQKLGALVAEGTGGTALEQLEFAKGYAQDAAMGELFKIAKTEKGQSLKHKALAQILGVPKEELHDTFLGIKGEIAAGTGKMDATKVLQEVETTAAEKQAQASAAAKISGAKKKWLKGEAFTPAQQQAWDGLAPEQQQSYLEAWEATKTTAKVQGGTTTTAPDVQPTGPQNLDTEIPDPAGLVKIADLSGSTKPYLAQDPGTGKKWVVKDSSLGGGGTDHFKSEALADAIYRAAGVNVPASAVVVRNGKAIKVAEFLEGGQTYAQWQKGKPVEELLDMRAEIRKNFVADALLANWDVAGLSNDNILVTADGVPVRIDNGGALFFRAQGGAKGLPPEVAEMQSLRDSKLNPNTADIFRGISQDEINDQIVGLLGRKDAILKAAESDPKVRDALAARLEWLEKQLPAAAKKSKPGKATDPGQIPAEISTVLTTGKRGAGTALVGDGDAIEDQEIRVWREVDTDKNKVVKMEADLTLAGSDRILKVLADAGMDVSTKNGKSQVSLPTPAVKTAGGAHPDDVYFQPILNAAKTVSTHATDGQYNTQTLTTFKVAVDAMENDLKKAATKKDPELVEMLQSYLEAAKKIEAAKAAGVPMKAGELVPYKIPTDWQPPAVKTTKAAKPVGAPEIDGWEITRLDRYDFTVKQMVGDELHDTGVVNVAQGVEVTADYGRVFQLKKGAVEVTVMAYREDAASNPTRRSIQGTLRVKINGADDVAAIEAGMQALQKIGIDASKPSDAQRELLYLHKVVALRRDDGLQAYTNALKGGTDEEKVEAVKKWAEKRYGVQLPRQKSDWGDAYNPEGVLPTNGTGARSWKRWDYTPAQIKTLTEKKVLFHSSSDPVGTFLAWVDNAGNATTTMGRVRTGVQIGNKGASSNSDMNKGGGNFLYTSSTDKSSAQRRTGFLFKGRNLARTDLRSDQGDSYGKWEAASSRRGKLEEMAAQTGVGISTNTGLLKNGLNIFDELDELRTGSPAVQKSIIAELQKRGINKWPDGRELYEVIF